MESNNEIVLSVCKDIPNHESFIKIEAINKGVSGDYKYYVETAQGQRYLLRISNIESYERKKTMYDMMKRVASLGVSMSVPVDFGICNNGKNVYQLLSWCDGETADVVLPELSYKEQYLLGVKAGQNLKKIHSIPAPCELEDWYDRFVRINDGRLRAFSIVVSISTAVKQFGLFMKKTAICYVDARSVSYTVTTIMIIYSSLQIMIL